MSPAKSWRSSRTVDEEVQASVLVADKECHVLKSQIEVFAIQRQDGPGGPKRGSGVAHRGIIRPSSRKAVIVVL